MASHGSGEENRRVGDVVSWAPSQLFGLLHVLARNQGVRDAQWDAKKQPAAGGHY